MKVKVSEASDVVLDFLVSKANNPPGKEGGMDWWERDGNGLLFDPLNECTYSPSTDWSLGGQIIERERIELRDKGGDQWIADDNLNTRHVGPTPLIAAMRCYAAARLGEMVDVPDELLWSKEGSHQERSRG